MHSQDEIIKEIIAAFEREPRIHFHDRSINLEFRNHDLVLDGEVQNIAAKQLALRRAAAVKPDNGIVDQLRVAPAQRRGDGAVRDSVCTFLLEESALRRCGIRVEAKGSVDVLREIRDDACGEILVSVENGIVFLTGHVVSRSHKRIAGVLAWWAPGSCDVKNALEVRPYHESRDDEITDDVRMVLEKDPLVHADSIFVATHDGVVMLQGILANSEERDMAELDAWYVCDVQDVINKIEVRQAEQGRPAPRAAAPGYQARGAQSPPGKAE